jgi:hypothetical protein
MQTKRKENLLKEIDKDSFNEDSEDSDEFNSL